MLYRQQDYPNLTASNHRDIITTPDSKYNCIAWAAGIDNDWWDPATGRTWPGNAPRDYQVTSLVIVYESMGFEPCANGSLEDGIEKIAIYAKGPEYMHAARQLETGKWTSKMGDGERIEIDTPEDLAGPAFGQVAAYMKRKRIQGTSGAS
jgi:hypothetical protein